VEMDRVEEWKMKKLLNKRKIREVVKYLVQWNRFTVEHDMWKKEENTKEVVTKFEGRLNIEVKR